MAHIEESFLTVVHGSPLFPLSRACLSLCLIVFDQQFASPQIRIVEE